MTKEYAVIATFEDYNNRRYSSPWVSRIDEQGKHDFKDVGTYTGEHHTGRGGDLVIYAPVDGQVYGYGQKDGRNPKYTKVLYARWDGDHFVPCDKLGRDR